MTYNFKTTDMTLTHKNYTGEYHYNPSTDSFSGQIVGIKEQVYFYGDTEYEIGAEFVKAVETYIKLKEDENEKF